MKYFMVIWEEKRLYNDSISTTFIKKAIKEAVGKAPITKTDNEISAAIINIGKDLNVLTGVIPNMMILQTERDDITENAITSWLKAVTFTARSYSLDCQYFVKEVLDPYPAS